MFNKNKKNKKKDEEFKLGFSKFKKDILKQKKVMFSFFVLNFLLYFIIAASPFLTGKILDALVILEEVNVWGRSMSSVWVWFGLYISLGLVHRTIHPYIFYYKIPKIANRMYVDFYQDKFSKIILFPTSFFKGMGMGKMIYSINTGAKSYSEVLLLSVRFLSFPTMAIFSLSFLMFLSWKVGLLILFFLIISIIYFKKTINKRKKVIGDFNNSQKEVSTFLTEKINLVLEVKKNNKEHFEKTFFKKGFEGDFNKNFFSKFWFSLKNNLVFDVLFFGMLVTLWFLVIILYQKGEITVGSILAIFMYSKYLLNVVRGILENINSFVEKFVLVGDTELLISHTPENYFKGKKRVDIQGEVEFINVSFGYEQEQNPLDIKKENSNSKILSVGSLSHKDNKGDSRAQLYESKDLKTQQNKSKLSLKKTFSLSNINLKINKGSKVAFVGESGGGKSTSIELVGGFYFPNKGEVLVDGVSTKDINLNDLRSSIAYVSQDIAIFNTTIGENISYGLNKDLKDEKEIEEKIKKAAKQANIAEFISSLPEGYSTEVGEKGLKLSGGQKQRIAIARAILRDPKILILDEPTSALDIESETKITKALENVMKGRTTIIIAHRISTVRDADKIFVFKEGQIVQSGTYKNLASTDGEFKKMVELHEGIE